MVLFQRLFRRGSGSKKLFQKIPGPTKTSVRNLLSSFTANGYCFFFNVIECMYTTDALVGLNCHFIWEKKDFPVRKELIEEKCSLVFSSKS